MFSQIKALYFFFLRKGFEVVFPLMKKVQSKNTTSPRDSEIQKIAFFVIFTRAILQTSSMLLRGDLGGLLACFPLVRKKNTVNMKRNKNQGKRSLKKQAYLSRRFTRKTVNQLVQYAMIYSPSDSK